MRIQSLTLENFKGFRFVNLELNGKDTVFYGVNGLGKSTALSSLAYLSQVWLRRLNSAQGKAFARIPDMAITLGEQSARIAYDVTLENECFGLSRTVTTPKANRRTSSYAYDKDQYGKFVSYFRRRFLDGDRGAMPIFVYYGTNRSVLSAPTNLPEDAHYDQLSALERACDNAADFKRFFSWYRDQESKGTTALRDALVKGMVEGDLANRNVTWGDLAERFTWGDLTSSDVTWADLAAASGSVELESVRRVVSSMVEGVTQLYVRRDPVRFAAVKDHKELNIELLSDGEKCTISLLGDLVRRLSLANPGLDNPLKGSGVVLIDEVDLHMHPSWQRVIMGRLRENFPNLQFIVATHSPQVLGELDDSYNIISFDVDSRTPRFTPRMDGFDSSYILEEFMGTPSQNPLARRLYQQACDLVDAGEGAKAEQLIARLSKLVGTDGKEYLLARGYFDRARFLAGKDIRGAHVQ